MIPVKLLDIFHDSARGESWLVLADDSATRGLAIFIGSWDAKFISLALRKDNPRPLTFNFFANVLREIGADLTQVQIVELVNNSFRSVACVTNGGVEKRIDVRPSDAVALATVMDRPIYVREEIMAAAGTQFGPEGRPPDIGSGFLSMRWCWSERPPPQ